MLRHIAPTRYLALGSTQAAAVLVQGVNALSTFTANHKRIPVNGNLVAGFFFLLPANNDTRTCVIWAGWNMHDEPGYIDPTQVWLNPLGSVAITAGNSHGATGGTAILVGEHPADTLVYTPSTTATTPKGPQAIYDNVYGEGLVDAATGQVFSPVDDKGAELIVPCLGRPDFLIAEFTDAGAKLANALYRLDRP